MLDILEKFLIRKGYCFSRFDGTTPMNARQSLVDEFNRSPSKQVNFGGCGFFCTSNKILKAIVELSG
jgi:hypothetical protein